MSEAETTTSQGPATQPGAAPPPPPVHTRPGPPPGGDGRDGDDGVPGPGTSGIRRTVRVLVLVALALVWVRLVLFEWLFPIIERQIDNPELEEAIVEVVELDAPAWTVPA